MDGLPAGDVDLLHVSHMCRLMELTLQGST